MRRLLELVYIIIAVLSAVEAVRLWDSDPTRAYLFVGFCVGSIVLFFSKRRLRKSIEENKNS